MIEGKSDKLRLADYIINVYQADFFVAAVKRNSAVVTHNKDFSFRDNLGDIVICKGFREGALLDIGLV